VGFSGKGLIGLRQMVRFGAVRWTGRPCGSVFGVMIWAGGRRQVGRCALTRYTTAFGRAVRVFDPVPMPGLKSRPIPKRRFQHPLKAPAYAIGEDDVRGAGRRRELEAVAEAGFDAAAVIGGVGDAEEGGAEDAADGGDVEAI